MGDREGGGLLGVVLAIEGLGDEIRGDPPGAQIGRETSAAVARATMPRSQRRGHRRVVDISGGGAAADSREGSCGGVPTSLQLALQ